MFTKRRYLPLLLSCPQQCSYSILPQQCVPAAENPAGNGELKMSLGSSPEEQCLEMCNTSIQVLLAMFMAEAGKCF